MEKYLQQQKTDCIKIVLFGPESTGKTSLAIDLAKHYKTVYVEEFARDFLQKKLDEQNKVCEIDDLIPIAIGQMNSENILSKKANRILFCDTDLLTTATYSRLYFNNFCASSFSTVPPFEEKLSLIITPKFQLSAVTTLRLSLSISENEL